MWPHNSGPVWHLSVLHVHGAADEQEEQAGQQAEEHPHRCEHEGDAVVHLHLKERAFGTLVVYVEWQKVQGLFPNHKHDNDGQQK